LAQEECGEQLSNYELHMLL